MAITSIYDLIGKHLSPYRRSGRDEVRAEICPFCNGGDSEDRYTFSINTDTGSYYCFRGSCSAKGGFVQLAEHFGESVPRSSMRMNTKSALQYKLPTTQLLPITPAIVEYFAGRKISEETLNAYGVSSDKHGNIVFPFYLESDPIFVKHRIPRTPQKNEPKEWADPDTRPILFGMNLCSFDQPLVITEGMIDTLSLYEAGVRNVVSVPSGCENMRWIEECWDWLERFDKIVIFGDNDLPGRQMVSQLVKRLGEARCSIVEDYPLYEGKELKDANEILCILGDLALLDTFYDAKDIPVRGLIDLSTVVPEDPTTIERIQTKIPALDDAIGGLRMGAITVFTGKPGNGKLLADDTPVLTRNGWKNHGDIVIGDEVVSDKGEWVKVLHVFPKGAANRKCTFSNGEVVYCHENHEWVLDRHGGNSYHRAVVETRSIESTVSVVRPKAKKGKITLVNEHPHRLIHRSPLIGDHKDLPVAPYTLGVWIGDGLTKTPTVCCAASDRMVIDGIIDDGYEISWSTVHKTTKVEYYGIKNLRSALRKFDMCHSHKKLPKHIPEEYLTASLEQRLALLSGLLDTDGHLDRERGRYTFSTVIPELRDSFVELVSTFGWRVTVHTQLAKTSSSGIKGKHDVYNIMFMPTEPIPCRVPRKQMTTNRRSHRIVFESIEKCEERRGNCIMVEGGVYCVGRTMIPTHNSTLSGTLLLNAIESGYNCCAYSGEMNGPEFQNWINLQAAGSDYITLKHDPVKNKLVPYVPADAANAIMNWYRGKLFIYDNNEIFDSNQADAILEVFTTAVRKHGCKLFLVDSLMCATSDTDEETRAQGKFVNALKRFANKYQVHIILIAHGRKLAPGKTTLGQDDIAGNSATIRLAHSAVVVEKPNLRVIKSRDSGQLRLIECCYCPDSHRIYQKDTGDLNRFSWNDGSIKMPKIKACDQPEYDIQVGQQDSGNSPF